MVQGQVFLKGVGRLALSLFDFFHFQVLSFYIPRNLFTLSLCKIVLLHLKKNYLLLPPYIYVIRSFYVKNKPENLKIFHKIHNLIVKGFKRSKIDF